MTAEEHRPQPSWTDWAGGELQYPWNVGNPLVFNGPHLYWVSPGTIIELDVAE